MAFPSQLADRRQSERSAVSRPGIIKLEGGEARACTVANISPMGALLILKQRQELPTSFKLVIPDDLFQAECEVRHQDGRQAGVLFTSNRAEAMARYSGSVVGRTT